MGPLSRFSLQTKEVITACVIGNLSVASSGDDPLVRECAKSRHSERAVHTETNPTFAQYSKAYQVMPSGVQKLELG